MNNQGMSKREMMRARHARAQMRNRIIVWGGLALVALGIGFLFFRPVQVTNVTPYVRTDVDFNAVGKADAPITITEYSDFQCPFCRRFWQDTEEQLMQAYVVTGTVRFVYSSLGSFIGPESGQAAEAAYCAGDQGKFWEYHDYLFANQLGENVGSYSTKKLNAFANRLNLDTDAFSSCLLGNKYGSRIADEAKAGVTAGVEATPTFIITYRVNGVLKTRRIEGAQGISAFRTEIEAALAEIAAAPPQ